MEKDFMEKLTEKKSSGTKCRNSNAEDHENVVGPSGKTIRESKRRKTNATEEGYENKRMPNMTSAGSLLKDSSAWCLMMDWAKDKIGYPDFDSKIREFGSRYIHDEWRPLIDAIFTSSDPSNEDPWPPSALVEEAMRTHGVSFDENEGMTSTTSAGLLLKDLSAWRLIMNWAEDKVGYPDFNTKIREFRSRFAAPADLSSVSASQRNPPQSAVQHSVQHSSGKACQKLNHRKTDVGRFLDLAAEEEDEEEEDEEEEDEEDEDEDIGDAQGSVSCPTDPGPSGKEFFNRAVDSMIQRYNQKSQPQDTLTQKSLQILEGVPIPLSKKLFIVDLFSGSSPAEVQQYLPLSHRTSAREITLMLPTEGTSLSAIKPRQILPVRIWVCIKNGLYKGDISFVERSDSTNAVLVVAPRKCPYDLLQQSGEKSLFCDELAILAGLTLEPILSPAGVGIGFTCGGHDFIYGLLRLTIPTHSVTMVGLPHPNEIAFHMIMNFKRALVEQTVQLFSAQFWRELDPVEIRRGDLHGSQGTLVDVDWHNNKEVVVHCPIQELRRVFTTGQAVRVIAGPYHGYIGHVIAAYGGTVSLQYDGQSPNLKVSNLLLESHVPDHVRSLNTKHTGIDIPLHEPTPTILPGDTVEVCTGAYKGAEAPIEWMSMDRTAWIYVKEKQDPSSAPSGIGSSVERHPNQQDDLIMERGYDVCMGDSVEIARGKWFRSEGVVHVVDFDKASLDLVCNTDGHKINVPITFCRKTAERSDLQLLRWVGRDVWVIRGEKKGYQATLRSLGRELSWVALQGHQLIQLKNDQIATPTGLLLNGEILPYGAVQEIVRMQHRSFVPVVHSVTPPPQPSEIPADGPWAVTAEDSSTGSSRSPDYGEIAWLFQPNFNNFQHYHLGFIVNHQYRPYNNASMAKHIV
ncbi:hypothetical protein SCLCIDRAFT_30272 [Scleroderma citrinum Foug A]|uniref:KOW domain-containing protein n=1 Tax=Scleroderma citrinum Foug A TaxID=1036808 RepID=A0A0C3DHN4_9AGAM|nr:hypothetical protein SCLCIDRAFT_30272 [Scleroderma citrinum Foug A]